MRVSLEYRRRLNRQMGHIHRFLCRQIHEIRLSNPDVLKQKFKTAFLFYLPNVLRRILLLPWALFGVLVIRCIRPFLRIRISPINATRIGHLILDTEMMLTEDKFLERKRARPTVDLWYVWKGRLGVSNKFVLDVWKRQLHVLPSFLLEPVDSLNRLLPGGDSNIFPYRKGVPDQMGQHHDIFGARRAITPHFRLSSADIEAGTKAAETLGIAPTDKLVCLQVRDSAYLRQQTGRDWFDDPGRNAQIDSYVPAAKLLTEKGIKLVRMGVVAEQKLVGPWSDDMVLDLPFSSRRSELLDIYLGSRCDFFVTTGSGIDAVAHALRVPLVTTNISNFERDLFLTHDSITIFRRPVELETGRLVSLTEFFETGDFRKPAEQLQGEGIGFIENSSSEILDVISEAAEAEREGFDEYLGRIKELELQREALDIFPAWFKCGGVKGIISPSFLKRHPYLLN